MGGPSGLDRTRALGYVPARSRTGPRRAPRGSRANRSEGRAMVILVLPAFNEAEAIVPLLTRGGAFVQRRALDLRVIVVDDGSKDDTAAAVRAFKGVAVQLIQHPQNRGLAEAIKTGLSAAVARCRDDDVIVTMDADDTHAPALMGRML